ncbi:MAG TPA: indolepyruvate oxidoreductase subunit beta [Anaerolineae bacterium]|jgi:indolepyruvate ferredoxin oxidoreductase beta subunit|nr:indolepyruvate oxidoreductase subunit beta [Anaerolineae bacterium]
MVTANFLLAGVGGQGTLLASDIVADVGMRVGADVKKSEVHGMSQRGGAVTSHVRWGERVASPLCEKGAVDYFIAQEMLEALRWIEFVRSGGTVFLSREQIVPTSTVYGADQYPADQHIVSVVKQVAGKVLLIDARKVAEELGNPRVANSVLLGALSAQIDTPAEDWLAVIESRVPQKHVETNRRAFYAGREGGWEI